MLITSCKTHLIVKMYYFPAYLWRETYSSIPYRKRRDIRSWCLTKGHVGRRKRKNLRKGAFQIECLGKHLFIGVFFYSLESIFKVMTETSLLGILNTIRWLFWRISLHLWGTGSINISWPSPFSMTVGKTVTATHFTSTPNCRQCLLSVT